MRFSIARKLGLDPRSLLDDSSEPQFVWKDEARFKNLTAGTPQEQAAIASFGMSTAQLLLKAMKADGAALGQHSAIEIRNSILASQPFVRLVDLLALCWALGIPVGHLRIFPLKAKRAAAMSARVNDRFAILLSKESVYPAWVAYYVAHELGHIMLGHLSSSPVMVDFESDENSPEDPQETEADRFALELLTGEPDPIVVSNAERPGARQLARRALEASRELRVEPGTLSLCFGHSTRDWATANAALKYIYSEKRPTWGQVNGVVATQTDPSRVPEDSRGFFAAVLGAQ